MEVSGKALSVVLWQLAWSQLPLIYWFYSKRRTFFLVSDTQREKPEKTSGWKPHWGLCVYQRQPLQQSPLERTPGRGPALMWVDGECITVVTEETPSQTLCLPRLLSSLSLPTYEKEITLPQSYSSVGGWGCRQLLSFVKDIIDAFWSLFPLNSVYVYWTPAIRALCWGWGQGAQQQSSCLETPANRGEGGSGRLGTKKHK